METASLLRHGADQTERSIYKRLPSLWSAVRLDVHNSFFTSRTNERALFLTHAQANCLTESKFSQVVSYSADL